ncbi:MAG TPA: efflux RND transporter periplasmic adaptor subunit [Longimicrobiaceae bacterium]|nr:efflux RND transporter periplasmic adaptor subunit [Longimicrobiaceae bacterium]
MNQNIMKLRVSRFALRALLMGLLMVLAACSSAAENSADEEPIEAHAGEQAEHEDEHIVEGADGRVTLTGAGYRTAGIEVAEVRGEAGAPVASGIEVPGRVEFAPQRVALISPRTSGRIERLTVVEGNRVGAGQPVAYVLNPAFLTAQNDLLQAARRAELLAGTQDEEGARALASAAHRRLQLLGAPSSVIERLQSGGEPLDLLPIVAPFAGSIIEAHALTGAAVEPGSSIYKIADLSVVDVVADVPEQALPHLEIGQSATVRLAAYPERTFTGRIDRLHDELNPETRTVAAIIHVSNSERMLRPGMFAAVSLQVPIGAGGSAPGPVLTIPASALVTDGSTQYVFVEVGLRTFEQREVEVTPVGEGRVAVRSGLAAGERVVTNGAFALKSEMGKASLGHGH